MPPDGSLHARKNSSITEHASSRAFIDFAADTEAYRLPLFCSLTLADSSQDVSVPYSASVPLIVNCETLCVLQTAAQVE